MDSAALTGVLLGTRLFCVAVLGLRCHTGFSSPLVRGSSLLLCTGFSLRWPLVTPPGFRAQAQCLWPLGLAALRPRWDLPPDQGLNLCLLHRPGGFFATGPPGNFPGTHFIFRTKILEVRHKAGTTVDCRIFSSSVKGVGPGALTSCLHVALLDPFRVF